MFSERIKTLATFISKEDSVLDVGTDHGYLPLFLKFNNLCQNVYASDISSNALNMAKKNFQKYGVDIKTFLTDGLKDIPPIYDTVVISGMGTNTILNILKNSVPKKLILGSNNDYYHLRKNLNKLKIKIVEEKCIYENKHYYVLMKCLKGKQKLSYKRLLFGISNDKDYYTYLLNKNNELIKKVPYFKKIKLKYFNFLLKGLIEKK